MFLYKSGEKVLFFTDAKEASDLYGLKQPDMEVSDEDFEKAGGLVRLINGKIFLGKTEQEKITLAQEEIRRRRNKLLYDVVDRMQGVLRWQDLSPEEKDKWTNYRRNLLDITEQPAFKTAPETVVFPEQPQIH